PTPFLAMIPSPRLLVFLIPSLVHSQELPPNSSMSPDEADIMETVLGTGKAEDLLGAAPSASNGQANHEDISQRPFLRRGEILEVVPGMIITQHSGGGKANQYFLRGFNLDHGTDFHVALGGMPVNFRSHAHGQGYADLGFL